MIEFYSLHLKLFLEGGSSNEIKRSIPIDYWANSIFYSSNNTFLAISPFKYSYSISLLDYYN